MCPVNIRGHETNFYEAEARCHEAEIGAEATKSEAEAEAEAEGGLNIPGVVCVCQSEKLISGTMR